MKYSDFPNFPVDNIPYGYIYRIINNYNQKTYIGQRMLSYDSHWRSYMGSGARLKKVMAKYGRSQFSKELIEYAYSRKELDSLEEYYIRIEKKMGKGNYNLLYGTTFKDADPSVMRNRSENVISKNKIKYESIFADVCEEILESYNTHKNIQIVSNIFNIPKKRIRDFLLENGIELNYQNIKGTSSSEEKKRSIRKGIHEGKVKSLNLKMELCVKCEDLIFKDRSSLYTLNDFCSPKCYDTYKSVKNIASCKRCLEPFAKQRSRSLFCSVKCSGNGTDSLSKNLLIEACQMYEEELMSVSQISKIMGVERKRLSKEMKKMGIVIGTTNTKRNKQS